MGVKTTILVYHLPPQGAFSCPPINGLQLLVLLHIGKLVTREDIHQKISLLALSENIIY